MCKRLITLDSNRMPSDDLMTSGVLPFDLHL